MNYHTCSLEVQAHQTSGEIKSSLAVENLLDFADLFLNFALGLIGTAFSLQTLVADQLAGALLDIAFGFFGETFDLIVSTVFHGFCIVEVVVIYELAGKTV
jgi:hypothetical protein